LVLQAFIDRDGQRCSHLLDLNISKPGLKVAAIGVPTPHPASLGFATTTIGATSRDDDGTDMPLLFLVSPGEIEYSIDYTRTRSAHCMTPKDEGRPAS